MDRQAAFDDWFAEAYPRVLAAVLLSTGGDRGSAEDATVEAFVVALDRWSDVSAMSSPIGWTIQVALNKSRRRWKRSRRGHALESLGAATTPEPFAEVDLDLIAAIERLPRRQRDALVLRYVEGLTQGEVARELGIAPGTAAATIHHAKRNLAKEMKAIGRNDY